VALLIGGKRSTPCHLDIPMRNTSVFLDNQAIVLRGEVIPEDQRARTPVALAAE
jgi:2,5-dihydroxypyridine 5,6-dioxygenase